MNSSSTEPSSSGFLSKNANREVRKLLARSYLQEMRIREALAVYLGVLRDAPDDTDIFLVLGNLYRLAGSPSSAMWLFHLVLEIQPSNVLARRMVLDLDEREESEWYEDNPMAETAIDTLSNRLESLTCLETLEKVRAAADLVGKAAVDEHGEEPGEKFQHLMPALIELNIREARAAGHSELAEALQSLQINLARQIDDRWADDLLRDESLTGPFKP